MLQRMIPTGVMQGLMLLACMYVGCGLEQETCSSVPGAQVCAVSSRRTKLRHHLSSKHPLINISTAWPQALTPGVCREATLT